jgi:hypothetical protein
LPDVASSGLFFSLLLLNVKCFLVFSVEFVVFTLAFSCLVSLKPV